MFENLERALFIVRLFVDHELLPFDHYFWFGLWISDVVIPWKLSQLRVLKSTHFRLDYPKSTLNLFFIWNQWKSQKKNKEKEFKISTTLQNTLKFCSLQYITKLFCPSICSDSAHFQISSPKSAHFQMSSPKSALILLTSKYPLQSPLTSKCPLQNLLWFGSLPNILQSLLSISPPFKTNQRSLDSELIKLYLSTYCRRIPFLKGQWYFWPIDFYVLIHL